MKRLTGLWAMTALGLGVGFGFVHLPAAQAQKKQHKVAICHGTSSDKNPYVLISVDESAVKAHLEGVGPGHGTNPNHHPDFLAVNGSCVRSSSSPSGS